MLTRTRHILTYLAILMMASSALISFFLVQKNDHLIVERKSAQEKTGQTIFTLWNNADAFDRNIDASVIVSLLTKNNNPDMLAIRKFYLARVGIAVNGGSQDVLKAADENRQHTVDRVNDLYIEQLEAGQEISTLEAANTRYAAFAFLLQLVSSVALVILTRNNPGT